MQASLTSPRALVILSSQPWSPATAPRSTPVILLGPFPLATACGNPPPPLPRTLKVRLDSTRLCCPCNGSSPILPVELSPLGATVMAYFFRHAVSSHYSPGHHVHRSSPDTCDPASPVHILACPFLPCPVTTSHDLLRFARVTTRSFLDPQVFPQTRTYPPPVVNGTHSFPYSPLYTHGTTHCCRLSSYK